MREESSQLRLLARMFGGDVPNAYFPYSGHTEAEVSELAAITENTDRELEPDGKGGYQWRRQ